MTTISVADVVVSEGAGFVDFQVRLDAASGVAVSVDWSTGNQNAFNGSDYTGASGTLTFAPGEILKTVRVPITEDLIAENFESFDLSLFSPVNGVLGKDTAIGTIYDNDRASGVPIVSISNPIVDEAHGLVTFEVALDRPSTGTVTMNYATQNGTALSGSDYTAKTGALSFAPGEMVKIVQVSLVNDATAEGSETFNLVLSSIVRATAPDLVGTATIVGNDATAVSLPRLSVADVVVGEGQPYAEFVVRLDAPSASAVSVNYNTSNQSAAGGTDYGVESGFLTFAPGEMVKTVRVPIFNDSGVETNQSFDFNLFTATNAVIGNNTAVGTIVDNDSASGTPVATIRDIVVDESSGEAVFTVTLDRPRTTVVTMSYATQDGDAIAGADYAATSGVLTFAPGDTVQTVRVSLLNDGTAEHSEAFKLVLSALVGVTSGDPVGTAIIAANDAPAVSLPRITVGDAVISEAQDFVDFVVRLDAPSTSAVSVNYNTSNQSAAGGTDYGVESGFLTFAPGEMVKTVRVPIFNDADVESNQTFDFNIFTPTNAVLGNVTAVGTIIDNDTASGVPNVIVKDIVVDESTGEAVFTVTLDRPSTSVVSMNFTTQDGSALAGSDYVAASGALSFGPGVTSQTVRVALINDGAAESSESFTLALSGVVNATALDPNADATIGYNDALTVSLPRITVADAVVGEGQSYFDFVVRLDAPSANAVTVNYNTSNQSAAGGTDYGVESGFLTFAPGETTKTVRIPVFNDIDAESNQSFDFNIFTPTNAVLGNVTAVGTIIDNDAASGTPNVIVKDMVVDEASGEAVFTVWLDRPSTSVVSMNFATQNGSALAGSDYLSKSGALSFAPGETAQTVRVSLLNDGAAELSESFNLVLSSVQNASASDPVVTAMIGANDAVPVAVPRVSVADVIAGEGQAFMDFVIRLDAPSASAVSVNYNSSNQNAAGGTDYGVELGFVTFAPGETVKIIRVPVFNDADVESDQSFDFNIFSPTGAVLGNVTAVGTIVDNDDASGPPIALMRDMVIDERAAEAVFTVSLNRPSTSVVTMNFATQNGTALAGSDYVATSGVLSFAPGETVQTVRVPLINDTTAEGSESFTLALTNAVNAAAQPAGTMVIAANDANPVAVPALSVGNVIIGESRAFVDFTVTLDAPGTAVVGVNYNMSSGTAAGGSDFGVESGTLVFAPGETEKTVRVPIFSDALVEASQSFTFNLFSATNATIANTTATGTIYDDLIVGGATDDTLTGGPADEILNGNDGNDTLIGGGGADILDGSNGVDTASYAGAAEGVIVNLETHFGSAGDAAGDFYGSIERVIGSAFNDTLTGDAGANLLDGGTGSDTMAGGAGNDTYVVERSGDAVTEAASAGTDLVRSSISYTLGANLENLTLLGAASIGATGNALVNVLTGNTGSNVINGGAGVDAMIGLTGNDTYVVDNVGDVVTEAASAGTDLVQSSVTYTLSVNVENLTLTGNGAINGTGNTLANVITGNANNNILNGGAGADTMIGGAGNDTYVVDNAGDVVTEAASAGTDQVQSQISYTLGANLENLRLTGSVISNGIGNNLANAITGSTGNNIINGLGGADTLNGSDGNDTINGGAGHDVLTGGAGNDHFVFTSINAADSDTIADFVAINDDIRLDNAVFTALGPDGALASAAFFASANGLAHDADDRVLYNTTTGQLFYDADGNGAGAAVLIATLTAHPAINAGDIFVI